MKISKCLLNTSASICFMVAPAYAFSQDVAKSEELPSFRCTVRQGQGMFADVILNAKDAATAVSIYQALSAMGSFSTAGINDARSVKVTCQQVE